jgi:hypothetical protein
MSFNIYRFKCTIPIASPILKPEHIGIAAVQFAIFFAGRVFREVFYKILWQTKGVFVMKQLGYIVISIFLLFSVTSVAWAADLSAENLFLTDTLFLPVTTADSGIIRSGSLTLIHAYGSGNFFSGENAGNLTMTGKYNTATGAYALHSNTTGQQNTASGNGALFLNTTGNSNTAIGVNAGYNQTNGSNNIYIGNGLIGVAGESNVIRIGRGATKTYIKGIYGSTVSSDVAVYINSLGKLGTLPSSQRFKEDIRDMGDATAGLMKLRPVTFYYKPEYTDGPRRLQYGLIAEEVAEIYPELVNYSEDNRPNTVYYQFVNAMLLNEVQKQHRKIEDLEARLARLEALSGAK